MVSTLQLLSGTGFEAKSLATLLLNKFKLHSPIEIENLLINKVIESSFYTVPTEWNIDDQERLLSTTNELSTLGTSFIQSALNEEIRQIIIDFNTKFGQNDATLKVIDLLQKLLPSYAQINTLPNYNHTAETLSKNGSSVEILPNPLMAKQ